MTRTVLNLTSYAAEENFLLGQRTLTVQRSSLKSQAVSSLEAQPYSYHRVHPMESANTAKRSRDLNLQSLEARQSNLTRSPSDTGVAYMKYPDSDGNSHNVTPVTTVNAIYNPIFTTISLYNSGTMNSTIQFQSGQAK